MSTNYVATIETGVKGFETDQVMELLASYHPSLSDSPRGWATATLTVPAESWAQACFTASAVAAAAFGAYPVAGEVMTEEEFNARQGWAAPAPEMLSVSEAAGELGVSRQRVLQMISEGKVQSTRIGRDHAIIRASLPKAPQGHP